MLRSALIWGRFAAFCIDLGPFCSVLHEFGVVLRRSALIGGRFAALCLNLGIWGRFAAFCSGLVLNAHALENEHIL